MAFVGLAAADRNVPIDPAQIGISAHDLIETSVLMLHLNGHNRCESHASELCPGARQIRTPRSVLDS